jgi:hypothetical protein
MGYTAEYNGWTNYETWRVNLEIFDGFDMDGLPSTIDNPYDLAEYLKEMADELVCGDAEGLARDYARAFMADVNWHEIAKHLMHTQEA